MSPLPTLFISHGAPTAIIETGAYRDFLTRVAATFPRPRAILAVTAHWPTTTPTLATGQRPETVHDFTGFPPVLYQMTYPAPGAPDLARHAGALLGRAGLDWAADETRGFDHGTWAPLSLLYPAADIPVAQMSVQPHAGPAEAWRLGAALAPLRDEGVLVVGSGAATHSLRDYMGQAPGAAPADWATAFAEWLAVAVARGDRDALLDYRRLAPHARRNHPTEEHLLPLFTALGAAGVAATGTRHHASIDHGVIAMDCYAFA